MIIYFCISNFLAAAEKYQATWVVIPPIFYEHSAKHLNNYYTSHQKIPVLQNMEFTLHNGAPLDITIGDFLRSKGLNIQTFCGMLHKLNTQNKIKIYFNQ